MVAFWVERQPQRRWNQSWAAMAWLPAFVVVMAALTGALCWDIREKLRGSLSLSRNFYGTLKVARYSGATEAGDHYSLQHGRILHGSQFIAKSRRREPTTYFGPKSGIGLALRLRRRQSPLRVGVVGLGTGTIAAYGEAGDRYTFYEINPQVKKLATSRFTYLTDSEADCDVALGDARVSLERQEPQHFDVLALDAFTSDAIPIHLLTREAFAVYARHLKPDAILAVHISNRFLDLEPVVAALAEQFGYQMAIIESESDIDQEIDPATWVLLTADQDFLNDEQVAAATRDDEEAPPVQPLLWTDDYSSLAEILR
jgi:spermidine synthase